MRTLTQIIELITQIIGYTIPIAVAVCLLVFLWGLLQVFAVVDNADKRKDGIAKMTWGVLALFVVVALAGIVEILSNTLLGN